MNKDPLSKCAKTGVKTANNYRLRLAQLPPAFTVCVLLYGHYPELAQRCLSRIAVLLESGLIELRIGANAISPPTDDVLRRLALDKFVTCRSAANIKKYPMMRRLFGAGDTLAPGGMNLTTPFVMWFDDDSFISAAQPRRWLALVRRTMEMCDLLGSRYTIRLKGNQPQWVRDQAWYTGQPINEGYRSPYCTGGWWTIRTEVLRRYGWPPTELLHRGGDVMLGELCRQQGLRMLHFNRGVAINADEHGEESKSPRRGFDSLPIGWHYQSSAV